MSDVCTYKFTHLITCLLVQMYMHWMYNVHVIIIKGKVLVCAWIIVSNYMSTQENAKNKATKKVSLQCTLLQWSGI